MNKLPLFFCCFLCAPLLPGQTTESIFPEWEVSNGNHDHTSRDQLHFTVKDKENNLIAVSSVENDSTFADIMMVKMSPGGEQIWTFHFSSGLVFDYDFPVKILIAPNNDIYLLGSAVYYTQEGAGYILKINAGGELLWRINMPDETVEHQFFNFFDGYLDDGDTLRVTYTCRSDLLLPAPTYCMSVTPEGIVTNKFQTSWIGQPTDSYTYGLNVFHNQAGEFVFILRDENIYNKFYLRRIHPKTGSETTISVSDQYLSAVEKTRLQYIEWEFVRQSDNGDVFAASNFNPFTPVDRFYLLRMTAGGVIQYIMESKTYAYGADFQDISPQDSGVVVTGLYASGAPYSTYLWKLNSEGLLVGNTTLQQNGHLIPQRLIRYDSSLYVHAISYYGDNAYVFKINAQLETLWSHQLTTPAGSGLAGSNILLTDSGQVTGCGTLRAKKHANSVFYSEEDVFIEQFTPNANGYNWQYLFNGPGTSHVIAIRQSVDPYERITVVAEEKTGPEPAFVTGSTVAPTAYYVYRYDTGGHLKWSRKVPHIVVMNHLHDIAPTDSAGNVYLPCYGNDTFNSILAKVKSDGSATDSIYVAGGIHRFFVSKSGMVYTTSAASGNSITTLSIIDAGFNLVNTFPVKGLTYDIFQLEGSDDVFICSVDNDSSTWQVPPRFYLYRNGLLEWERTLPTQMFETVLITRVDHNPVTGRLYLSSFSNSVLSSRMHGINLDGTSFESTAYDDLYTGDIYCQRNGNIYKYYPDKLVLFDAAMMPAGEYAIGNAGYIFYTEGDYFYAFEAGSVYVFDNEGNHIARLYSPDITAFFGYAIPSRQHALYIIGLQGQGFFTFSGTGGNFGWRWFRGILKKFDISTLVSDIPVHAGKQGGQLSGYPNPAGDLFYISVPDDFQGQSCRIDIFDAAGRLVRSLDAQHTPSLIALDCSSFPAGHYVVRYRNDAGSFLLRFQKP